MAPEAWRGEPPTARADVYSLGVLLFELLAGRPPHQAASRRELRARVLAGEIADLRALAPGAPPAVVELVLRCLRPRADERPTARELCDALALATATGIQGGASDDDDANPYRGLLPFGREHHAVFLGREAETEAVLGELRAHPMVLVAGASGAGKSSLLQAGVVPRAEQALGRRALVVAPGGRPTSALARALAARSSPEERVLLVVDPLEEAWTLASARERSAFFEALVALVGAGLTLRVVAALRSDFLPRLEDLDDLRALALRAPVVLGPLSSAGLRRAIAEPARRRGVTVEAALVETLVAGAEGASLPLLGFALAELWERRDPEASTLGLDVLERLGGVTGALAAHAEATLARMAPAVRRVARPLLLALVTVDGTRARREEDELLGDSPDARLAVEALVEARLVVVHPGERGAGYEIAHEALLSGWPTLRDWLDEDAAAREETDRVRRAAAEWERLAHDGEALFGERQLTRLDTIAGAALPLAGREARFVAASRAAVRRARARRRLFAWGVPLLIVAAMACAWAVVSWRHRVVIARAVDDARALEAAADTSGRTADAMRTGALALFEKDALGPAEALWKETLAAEERADAQRRDAGDVLDRALSRDPQDAGARALYADVIFARLLAAERRHENALASSLRSRLGLYDDGTRAARLRAPGRVDVETDPPGASLTLARYREDSAGRLVEADAAPLPAGVSRELEPGSYVLHAAMADRYPTTYPFVVRRGESQELVVVVPRAGDVPEGMLYVPAGRFLYGSGDDELTRGFLAHEPLHEIAIGAFLVARTEVTYGDYLTFLRALPPAERMDMRPSDLDFRPDGRAVVQVWDTHVVEGSRVCLAGVPCADFERLPVDAVSRSDGERYAAWLSASGRLPGARLCTDREWERAARGADNRLFPDGKEPGPDEACTLATYRGAPHAGPCVVGSHPATRSPFGADDMVGGVWEWIAGAADVAKPDVATVRGGSWTDGGLTLALPGRGLLQSARFRTFGLRICAGAR